MCNLARVLLMYIYVALKFGTEIFLSLYLYMIKVCLNSLFTNKIILFNWKLVYLRLLFTNPVTFLNYITMHGRLVFLSISQGQQNWSSCSGFGWTSFFLKVKTKFHFCKRQVINKVLL